VSTYESMELLGMQADRIDSLIGALQLPIPDALHLKAMRAILPEIRDALRRVYVIETQDDPWETRPLDPQP
jgi:hypothetical protein